MLYPLIPLGLVSSPLLRIFQNFVLIYIFIFSYCLVCVPLSEFCLQNAILLWFSFVYWFHRDLLLFSAVDFY